MLNDYTNDKKLAPEVAKSAIALKQRRGKQIYWDYVFTIKKSESRSQGHIIEAPTTI